MTESIDTPIAKSVSHFTLRTSGRRVFRRCMRKWGYQSSMRRNLQRKGTETNINFWFGSGIHFAMEDFFGYNKFGDPIRAFQAYYAAFKPEDRPVESDDHYYLGMGMLDYFKTWYSRHNEIPQFQTIWLDKNNQVVAPATPGARPLVEESFMLDLNIKVWVAADTEEVISLKDNTIHKDDKGFYIKPDPQTDGLFKPLWDIDDRQYIKQVPLYYHGTLDRVVIDRQGRWWIMDWKTAKSADTNKLDTDDQISAYMWAAEQWFGHPIHGFVYVQLTKDLAKPPKRLANGNLSVDKKQKTTHALLKQELIKEYGTVSKAPQKLIDFLTFLAEQETPEGDRFVRWDLVLRNREQKHSTYKHILAEASMMANPNLYLFPNPTRDCIWDCPFREACILEDMGKKKDAQVWLDTNFEPRPRGEDGNLDPWRKDIPWPDKDKEGKAITTLVKQMDVGADTVLNIILPDAYKEE